MFLLVILSAALALSGCAAVDFILEDEMLSSANADVEFVRAVETGDGVWTFHVTVRHPDTGWEDYADGWDVVLPDGTIIKPDPTSPFTRLRAQRSIWSVLSVLVLNVTKRGFSASPTKRRDSLGTPKPASTSGQTGT